MHWFQSCYFLLSKYPFPILYSSPNGTLDFLFSFLKNCLISVVTIVTRIHIHKMIRTQWKQQIKKMQKVEEKVDWTTNKEQKKYTLQMLSHYSKQIWLVTEQLIYWLKYIWSLEGLAISVTHTERHYHGYQ